MKTIVVQTQADYYRAERICQETLEKSFFDVDSRKGLEILEEVDYILYNFFTNRNNRVKTEAELSRYHFTQEQARGIIDFFKIHQPDDLYDIERGLNKLYLYRDRELNLTKSLIEIRDSREKITVSYPVSVYDTSRVEASGYAVLYAYDEAHITVRDHTLIHAFNKANIEAYDNANVVANHNSTGILYEKASAVGHNEASLKAHNNSRITLYGKSSAVISGFSKAAAYNNSSILAHDYTIVDAFDKAVIEAKDTVKIFAENDTVIIADDRVKVSGNDNVLVIATETVDCSPSFNICKIEREKNTGALLEQNIRHIATLPYFNHDALKAANMLLRGALPREKAALLEEVKKYQILDKTNIDRYLAHLQQASSPSVSPYKNKGVSWRQ